ncbi:hypothetical protein DYB38_012049, partial [Aphanomyces astaci]
MNTLSSACFVSAITAADASTMCLIKADRMDYRVLAFDIFRGGKSQPKEPEDYHGMFNHEYFIKSFESLLNELATLGIQNASIGKQSRTKTGRLEVPKEQEQPGQEDGEPSRKTPRTRAETPEQTIENQEGTRAQPEPLTNLPPYKDDTYVLPDRVLRAEQPKDPFVLAMKAYLECKALPLDAWLMRLVTRTHEHYA